MRILRIAMIVAFVCVCAQIACAADPLLIQVNCQGCSGDRIGIPNGYQFRADVGKEITLVASSTGGAGNRRYEWTERDRVIYRSNPFQLTVAEDIVEYLLTVTDDGGSVKKVVRIVPNSFQKSECLPDFRRGITICDGKKAEYVKGDIFTVKVRIDTSDCPDSDYELYWTADDENIIFVSPSSAKTEVIIGQGISTGEVKIEIAMTNGEVIRRPKNGGLKIEIVKNIPPQFEIEYSDPPIYSCEEFEVWASDFKPSDGDYSYSATLTNEQEEIVSTDEATGRDGEIPYLELEPNWFQGIYRIDMTVENPHGLSATATGYVGDILRGKNDRNAPIVYAPDVVYCIVNEICEIDASETMDKDRYVSNFGFYNVAAKERLANSRGDYYSGPVCNYTFTYPGTYKIEVRAKYFDEDSRRESEVGSKIVAVIVSPGNISVIPTPTPILTPIVTPTSVPVFIPTVAHTRTNIVEEPETKKEWFFNLINAIIKNALNL